MPTVISSKKLYDMLKTKIFFDDNDNHVFIWNREISSR